MKAFTGIALFVVLGIAGIGAPGTAGGQSPAPEAPAVDDWQQEFGLPGRTLSSTGRNPYFILEPGFQLSYASEDEKLVITVLDDTVQVGDVKTRVVEEREWKDGQLVEVSRNYFAIDPATGDVFYFGEEVDDHEGDRIIGHGGAWRADAPGAKAGLAMPGEPRGGMKYYLEVAPGVAMDRAEVVSLDAKLSTPAGDFEHCLKTQEGSALKPSEKEFKIYASGIGLIRDGDMLLTGHGFIAK